MPYVQRDLGGAIKGVYAVLQPGLAEELLPDTDQEVVDFRTLPPPPPKSAATLTAEEVATELVRKGVVTRAEFDTIKTKR